MTPNPTPAAAPTDDELVQRMAFAYVGDSGRSISICGMIDALEAIRSIIEREALEKAAADPARRRGETMKWPLPKKLRDCVYPTVSGSADADSALEAADAIERLQARVAELEKRCADYEQVLADKRRLAREIDVAMHGEEGAAKQPSLCDLVGPAEALRKRNAELEKWLFPEDCPPADQERDHLAEQCATLGKENDALQSQARSLRESGAFLIDRLRGYRPDDDGHVRDYYGHIEPAIARLQTALEAAASIDLGTEWRAEAEKLAEALEELKNIQRFATGWDNGVTDSTGSINEGDHWHGMAMDAANVALEDYYRCAALSDFNRAKGGVE